MKAYCHKCSKEVEPTATFGHDRCPLCAGLLWELRAVPGGKHCLKSRTTNETYARLVKAAATEKENEK